MTKALQLAAVVAGLIFGDGFESRDLREWSSVQPAPKITCLTLPADQLSASRVVCGFTRPGVYEVRLEACNELGCDETAQMVKVLDPAFHGACCLRDGSCRETMAAECGFLQGEWNGYRTRCRSVTCEAPPPPPPEPVFAAEGCLFGFCLFPAGTTVRFRQEHLAGPFRYGFETQGDTCQSPPPSQVPITEHTYRRPGLYRPCVKATDLAGDQVVLFNQRPISILEE